MSKHSSERSGLCLHFRTEWLLVHSLKEVYLNERGPYPLVWLSQRTVVSLGPFLLGMFSFRAVSQWRQLISSSGYAGFAASGQCLFPLAEIPWGPICGDLLSQFVQLELKSGVTVKLRWQLRCL